MAFLRSFYGDIKVTAARSGSSVNFQKKRVDELNHSNPVDLRRISFCLFLS